MPEEPSRRKIGKGRYEVELLLRLPSRVSAADVVGSLDALPDVEVAVLDEFERFLAQLPDFERKVLELKLHGNTTTEIAEALGSYDRKIRRVLERIEAVAQGAATEEEEG